MAKTRIDIKDITHHIGHQLGTSRWVEITQSRVNKFAEATGNFQWIHVDEEQARSELPAGRTIAHNFLLLSLVPHLFDQIVEFTGLSYGQNKGVDNMCFLEPLPTGSRVRIHIKLAKLEYLDQKSQSATFNIVMEKEGSDSPIMTLDQQLLFVITEKAKLHAVLPDQHQRVAL